VADSAAYQRWLSDISGYPAPALEVEKRTLRIKDNGAPAREPAQSTWTMGTVRAQVWATRGRCGADCAAGADCASGRRDRDSGGSASSSAGRDRDSGSVCGGHDGRRSVGRRRRHGVGAQTGQ